MYTTEDPSQSSNKNLAGTTQQTIVRLTKSCCALHCLIILVRNSISLLQYELVQGSFGSNVMGTAAPLVTNNMMPFVDNSMMFVPPIQEEFTNLLLHAE